MALRLLETFIPDRLAEDASTTLSEAGAHSVWREPTAEPGESVLRAMRLLASLPLGARG